MNATIDTDRLFAYEEGILDEDESIQLIQDLIDTGLIEHLQGHYQRTALRLIENGDCHLAGSVPADDDVYAMHGIDDGPAPEELDCEPDLDLDIFDESGLLIGTSSPLRKAIDASEVVRREAHVKPIWGQEPE